MEINRDTYLKALLDSRHNNLIKVITGLRRVGKSYTLFTIFKRKLIADGVDENHIIEMAFDDYANREYRNPDKFFSYVKSRITDKGMYYILLDEVQMLDEFVDVLNGFLHIGNVDVYITGSNAKFLSKDIVTEFRGRGTQIRINPLTFREFMSVYAGDAFHGWTEYIQYGGLPMVVLAETPERKAAILKELVDELYISDILNRNRIKNDAELSDLFRIIASNIGALTNPMKLSNTFKSEKHVDIKSETINRYIEYFKDSFLIEESTRFDIKGKKYINTPHKYYFNDVGLRNSVLNFRQVEPTHLMENIIYNELRARGFSVDVGDVVVNSKLSEGKSQRKHLEVDFVCNSGFRRYYIQSALELPTEEKRQQELNSLLSIKDGFRKIIIVGGIAPTYQDENGVLMLNVFDFLLKENSLEA
ncbi:MAG: ATP-binding protein [Muribaculaceae bacterium]|jgi:predicted AAA+ superfamily ATPase|nr:ATP-binding protein [Muribaculaceae bacterium]